MAHGSAANAYLGATMPELLTQLPVLVAVAAVGYLLGSIPFGIVMARLFGLGDLRQIGSGNIGATNVLRTGNKPAALLTLLGDAGKGAAAVLIARALFADDAAQIAGFAAFLGHCFPIFLGFNGGKGVATWLGTMLALAWPVGLTACITWLVVALLFRVSSLAALAAAALSPIWAMLLGFPSYVVLSIALALLIFLRHRANIERLIAGDEPRIGGKK
ncbi:acyl-phosphate glycerol-3-phosphate acyltransferase [Aliiroseovarius sediminilitoris]|uniref:Glycerol-3-phosphate acyltransferase n=2 Tax=Aliiroseovarius sediminilitoris TaxID=1173584 RepID=A0A1I0QT19_9RHOB|nr:acyl-phosphate glycerol-3-phosphate acyltransferase [Aliiroseovarius sediminilitoris]